MTILLFSLFMMSTLNIKNNIESFNMITFFAHIELGKCKKGNEDKCKILLSKNSLNKETYVNLSKGSGFIIKHDEKNTFIITANHVCDGLYSLLSKDKYRKFAHDFIVKFNKSTENFPFSFKIKFITSAIDFYGKIHIIKEIVKRDKKNDLCMLRSNKVWGKKVIVSKNKPKLGDELYNLSTPHGYMADNMVPILKGYFSGIANNIYIYTIPAAEGSSGSPVFNKQGELVSILHSVLKKFSNISNGASLDSIKKFISSD